MGRSEPLLSVVVTCRNDNHGGNLLRRMQAFINGLIGQCNRHDLDAELIVVEWNPPPDRPRLSEALRWPAESGACRVRILEVPPELHRRFRHAHRLPLFQMIAKNVGIRRARGRFILATNIDILFSDELMQFIASGGLQSGKIYRIDRYDAAADVPVDAPVDEQLTYCRDHLIRVNTREGTFDLTPDGVRIPSFDQEAATLDRDDLASADLGLRFGAGWYPPERCNGSHYRWARNDAAILVRSESASEWTAHFAMEPGPGLNRVPFMLEVRDGLERTAARAVVTGDRLIALTLPLRPGRTSKFTFHTTGGGQATPDDERILDFRVFGPIRAGQPRWRMPPRLWLRRLARLCPDWLRGLGRLSYRAMRGARIRQAEREFEERRRQWLADLAAGPIKTERVDRDESAKVPALHSTACGDFTLMAREQWETVRGYPELEMFSLHIDTVLLYLAYFHGWPEEVLPEPMRIYHIEHAVGSGWTPQGCAPLLARLAKQNVPVLDPLTVMEWAHQMSKQAIPLVWNTTEWGLADADISESVPGAPAARSNVELPAEQPEAFGTAAAVER
ncbi:MAG: hypothetical protein JNM56_30740 [Planctomycetia bacterium]|nr:hypothetical protein [Planctomycetia bacterium]